MLSKSYLGKDSEKLGYLKAICFSRNTLLTYLKTILDIGSEKIGSNLPILTIIWHFSNFKLNVRLKRFYILVLDKTSKF